MKISIDDVFHANPVVPVAHRKQATREYAAAAMRIADQVHELLRTTDSDMWKYTELLRIRFEDDLDGEGVTFTVLLKWPDDVQDADKKALVLPNVTRTYEIPCLMLGHVLGWLPREIVDSIRQKLVDYQGSLSRLTHPLAKLQKWG